MAFIPYARHIAMWAGLLTATGATAQTTCDLNGDGTVNVVDVQLIVNMEINVAPCSANVGGVLGCSDPARLTVIKAALGQGCHFVSLSWSPSPSAGVTGYNVYRSTAPGGAQTKVNQTPVTGTGFTDVNVTSGTTYYYVLTATDGSNESGPSAQSSVTAL